MVLSLTSAKRRRQLAEDAHASRASLARRLTAWGLILIYNIVGGADILSTMAAIDGGFGEEANPVLLLMMQHAGEHWILGKLALQAVISFMVIWFPHWIVLGFFACATAGNAWVVYNNLQIAGVF